MLIIEIIQVVSGRYLRLFIMLKICANYKEFSEIRENKRSAHSLILYKYPDKASHKNVCGQAF